MILTSIRIPPKTNISVRCAKKTRKRTIARVKDQTTNLTPFLVGNSLLPEFSDPDLVPCVPKTITYLTSLRPKKNISRSRDAFLIVLSGQQNTRVLCGSSLGTVGNACVFEEGRPREHWQEQLSLQCAAVPVSQCSVGGVLYLRLRFCNIFTEVFLTFCVFVQLVSFLINLHRNCFSDKKHKSERWFFVGKLCFSCGRNRNFSSFRKLACFVSNFPNDKRLFVCQGICQRLNSVWIVVQHKHADPDAKGGPWDHVMSTCFASPSS